MKGGFKEKKKEMLDRSKSSNNNNIGKKTDFVSWAAFQFTIIIVFISLIPVVFPSFVTSNNSIMKELAELGIFIGEMNPFEVVVWGGPLIISNIVIFAIALFYFKKRLPEIIKKPLSFIFRFEVSKKVALISLVAILAIYVAASAGELGVEEEWEDYPGVKKRVDRWSPDQAVNRFETHVRYFFILYSLNIFGSYSIVPFLASIALLVTTYLLTVEISKKRFAGIVAVLIVLQSNLFLTYDTTVSYTNFWILFYLLSLYFIYKVWPLSPISFLLSIPSKALTAMFFPMLLFFIYRSSISSKKKVIISASITAVILAGATASVSGVNFGAGSGLQQEFDSNEFWLGFTSFSYQLRFDGIVLLFILPLIVGLYISSRYGIKQADSIMVLIGGLLLTAPLLTGFTELTNQPYRFVPLVVFFAIGVGVILSKKPNQKVLV